jgi:hypothetical protein
MWDQLHDLLFSSFKEILGAVTAAAVLYVRAWVQARAAVNAAEYMQRNEPDLPGAEKKTRAMQSVKDALPRGVRPLTDKGLDHLVERAVPKAKKRIASEPPPPVQDK